MPGTTPIYGFPYPEPTDLVADYPALGQQLAEDVETEISAKLTSPVWTAFTPSWTNLTVGNGSNSGFYMAIGKIVFGHIAFTLGSTSSVGSSPKFAAPMTISGNMLYRPLGSCYLWDSGTTIFTGVLTQDSQNLVINSQAVAANDPTIDPVTSTNPMTWVSGDIIGAWFQYQID